MDSQDVTPQTTDAPAAEPLAPEPLTATQRAFAAALPDAERAEFEAMSSADRDELIDVMGWAGVPGVEIAADAYEQARADLAVLAARAARPGGHWRRNPETAPQSRAELDALDRADDEAVDQALAVLGNLIRQASRHTDLRRRSRMLARVDRAMADPRTGTGFARRLRELRTHTLNARYEAGVPVQMLASEAGVSVRRMKQLINGTNRTYVSAEMKDVKAELAAQRAERAAQTKARKAAEKEVDIAQGAAWAARVLAGEKVQQIAAQEGVRWQLVAGRIRAARRAQSVRDAA